MKNKKMILGSSILLVVLLVIGGTMAWFTASTDPVENKFKAGTLEIEVEETFDEEAAQNVNPGDSYEKLVKVNNIGSKKAFVRLKLVADFEGLPTTVATYPILNGWVLHTDGYYYYPAEIAVGGATPNIIEAVTFAGAGMGNEYQGKKFTLSVTDIEAIQVTNGAALAQWGVDPATLAE